MNHPINLLTQIWQDREYVRHARDDESVTLQGRLQVSAFKLGLLVAYACLKQAVKDQSTKENP